MANRSPLLAFLVDRHSVDAFDPQQWSLLFAEARAASVLPRLAVELQARPGRGEVPEVWAGQVRAALQQMAAFVADVGRELVFIDQAVDPLPTRVILLKGAAYAAAGLPAARGRVFSDVDLLVERECLGAAEAALMLAGWNAGHLSAYDQRYYREWSHEVPPMMHLKRGTTIDLHHSLVMPTCRIKVDVASMIAAAVPIAGPGKRYRLNDTDIVLHAASHLLFNSEFDKGLRDLWDIDLLVRHFSADNPGYLAGLLERADRVGLGKVIRRALTLCQRLFGLDLPTALPLQGGAVMALLLRAASTRHPDARPGGQTAADQLLMLRELYLRLPAHLLVRHLWHKAAQLFAAEPAPGKAEA